MDEYIKQLLEIIQISISKGEATLGRKEDEDEIEYIDEYADQYINGTPVQISSVTGIDKFQFPPIDQIDKNQTSQLLNAIEDLLLTFNWEFIFPENVNDEIKYEFITDKWDSKHVHCKHGLVQIETCKFNDKNCPFPSQCQVCDNFKDDSDKTHHLCKGKVDFNSLMPSFDNSDESIRQDINKFKELMRNNDSKNSIVGIHNYCDGRCDQCAFTDRCSSYSLHSVMCKAPDGDFDIDAEKQMMVMLQATSEFIEEELERKGIDPKQTMEELSRPDVDNHQEKHPLEKKAESYAEKVKRWLETNQRELESRIVKNNDKTGKYFESITWFQLFIPAKISRALGSFSLNHESTIDNYDSNGSAKAALLGIDESIWAWENLLNNIQSKEDSILNILTHLSQLRDKIESTFPKARDFKRPGFDTK